VPDITELLRDCARDGCVEIRALQRELRFIGGAQRDQRIKILVANDDPTKIRQP